MIKILKCGRVPKSEIFSRFEPTVSVEGTVSEIIAKVKSEGDGALYYYAEKFDKVKLASLEVSEDEIAEAYAVVDSELIAVMEKAKENIVAFHSKQKREGFEIKKENGLGGRTVV